MGNPWSPCAVSKSLNPKVSFTSFPQTEPPPGFAQDVVRVFQKHLVRISTERLPKGLTSDEVLSVLADDLARVGFEVERSKAKKDKISRPVFFGEDGQSTLRYEIDAYHPDWECGLEVEAGRAWMGNAIYRDLIQAAVMVGMKHLCLAVSKTYKYKTGGKMTASHDYRNTVEVARALFGHSRIQLPYGLTVIGY